MRGATQQFGLESGAVRRREVWRRPTCQHCGRCGHVPPEPDGHHRHRICHALWLIADSHVRAQAQAYPQSQAPAQPSRRSANRRRAVRRRRRRLAGPQLRCCQPCRRRYHLGNAACVHIRSVVQGWETWQKLANWALRSFLKSFGSKRHAGQQCSFFALLGGRPVQFFCAGQWMPFLVLFKAEVAICCV